MKEALCALWLPDVSLLCQHACRCTDWLHISTDPKTLLLVFLPVISVSSGEIRYPYPSSYSSSFRPISQTAAPALLSESSTRSGHNWLHLSTWRDALSSGRLNYVVAD